MPDTTIFAQIQSVQSVDDQCIDSTIYQLGTPNSQTYQLDYNALSPDDKAIVDNFRQLIINNAPA